MGWMLRELQRDRRVVFVVSSKVPQSRRTGSILGGQRMLSSIYCFTGSRRKDERRRFVVLASPFVVEENPNGINSRA